jgi:hypothetical protein
MKDVAKEICEPLLSCYDEGELTKEMICEPLQPDTSQESLPKAGDVDGTIYSLADVGQHCTPSDFWCAVHGKVYDLTQFVPRHPGGDVISLASGIDATILFETYHVRSVNPSIVKKYQIGTLQTVGSKGEANSCYSWDSPFYSTLKKRVAERLGQLGKPRRGGFEIWVKAACLVSLFWALLGVMCLVGDLRSAFCAAFFLGAVSSFIGTCVQHDGNHGAFSRWSALNKAAGWTLDMIGASAFTWEMQHMLGHHPYTNLLDIDEERRKNEGGDGIAEKEASVCGAAANNQESDPDVFSSFPFLRMHPYHQRKWFHKYQHFYSPVLFSTMTLAKVYQQDFEMLFAKRLYHINAACRYDDWRNVARFWTMKVLSTFYMIVLPCYFRGVVNGFLLFLVAHLVCGELLALMFIVNHVIEGVAFAKREVNVVGGVVKANPSTPGGSTLLMDSSKGERMGEGKKTTQNVPANDWAAVQCQTSVNWSSGSWFWNHFSGGLAHQIEHHLFPAICHTNYVHIQAVVEKTCQEFGVPYSSEPSLFTAIVKMMRHLKHMGTTDYEDWR